MKRETGHKQFAVIAGLDPAIHRSSGFVVWMDARVKPGHDE
jgi:hypothetical protein